MTAPAATASVCEGCGTPASGGRAFCGHCGARLTSVPADSPTVAEPASPVTEAAPKMTPPPRRPPLARTQPRHAPQRPAQPGPQLQPPGAPAPQVFYPPAIPVAHERPTSPALLVTIATFLVLAFAGAAVAIVLAVTSSDSATPASSGQTTITVITHAQ